MYTCNFIVCIVCVWKLEKRKINRGVEGVQEEYTK